MSLIQAAALDLVSKRFDTLPNPLRRISARHLPSTKLIDPMATHSKMATQSVSMSLVERSVSH